MPPTPEPNWTDATSSMVMALNAVDAWAAGDRVTAVQLLQALANQYGPDALFGVLYVLALRTHLERIRRGDLWGGVTGPKESVRDSISEWLVTVHADDGVAAADYWSERIEPSNEAVSAACAAVLSGAAALEPHQRLDEPS